MIELIRLHTFFCWTWVLLGIVSGAIIGLFAKSDTWLGSAGSYKRRMLRLGHISFLGFAFLNHLFVSLLMFDTISVTEFSAHSIPTQLFDLHSISFWLCVGSFGMPLVCILSAFRDAFYALFFIPVCSAGYAVLQLVFGFAVMFYYEVFHDIDLYW